MTRRSRSHQHDSFYNLVNQFRGSSPAVISFDVSFISFRRFFWFYLVPIRACIRTAVLPAYYNETCSGLETRKRYYPGTCSRFGLTSRGSSASLPGMPG